MRTILALGGNAFAAANKPVTMASQFEFARHAMDALQPVLADERELVVTHGNGPQVGHMLIRVEEALGKAYGIPLEVCVAESEGELGYVLELSLHNALAAMGKRRPIAGLLTQVVVSDADPAFENPTKPIGPFYSASQAHALGAKGFAVREDAGRGFRRVVPSPEPLEVVDTDVIETLLNAQAIVIAAGGGGIPVVRDDGALRGVEAVVDKDLTSAVLGSAIHAEMLVILTDVPCAYREFGTQRQAPIGQLHVADAQALIEEGHFGVGSMLPKMEAAVRFCRRPGTRALICNVDNLRDALDGNAGTIVCHESF